MLAEGTEPSGLATSLNTLGKPSWRSPTPLPSPRAGAAAGQGSGGGSRTCQGVGGSCWGEGGEKGFISPYLRAGAARGLGETPAVSHTALAACLSAVGDCWVRSPRPWGHCGPAGSSFPRRLTPFLPTFAAGMCKPPAPSPTPPKDPREGCEIWGTSTPSPSSRCSPQRLRHQSHTGSHKTHFAIIFFPISIFFPPFPEAKAVFPPSPAPLSSHAPSLQPGCSPGWPERVLSSAV